MFLWTKIVEGFFVFVLFRRLNDTHFHTKAAVLHAQYPGEQCQPSKSTAGAQFAPEWKVHRNTHLGLTTSVWLLGDVGNPGFVQEIQSKTCAARKARTQHQLLRKELTDFRKTDYTRCAINLLIWGGKLTLTPEKIHIISFSDLQLSPLLWD